MLDWNSQMLLEDRKFLPPLFRSGLDMVLQMQFTLGSQIIQLSGKLSMLPILMMFIGLSFQHPSWKDGLPSL